MDKDIDSSNTNDLSLIEEKCNNFNENDLTSKFPSQIRNMLNAECMFIIL